MGHELFFTGPGQFYAASTLRGSVFASSPCARRPTGSFLSRTQTAVVGKSTSYKLDYRGHEPAPSTASQTAWALMGLMAARQPPIRQSRHEIEFLLHTRGPDGFWAEDRYTATGFPGFSIYAIMAIRSFFRFGLWLATEI